MIDELTMQQVVARIVAVAQPSRVILFGSYGRGDASPDSDLDIMVIKPHVPNRYQEMLRLRKAVGTLGVGTGIDRWFILRLSTSGAVRYPARCSIGREKRGGPCMLPHLEEAC